ncbi:protein RESTRICTED TEV MOVEMENT 2 [Eutrema salsugineum]|nr:protein RESTRICTED TEV MOVEMENT 2 [Eutrema salsugineum]
MIRRPRPGGGRHPPPLAPTVSSFKPRAQWSNSGSTIFLYVNLPGFYRDQIEIKKDERSRIIQIQGQRPLSTQTKARFNETYRVPGSCDMTKLSTSFSHGLLTIEFPAVVEDEKAGKSVQDQGKIVQSPNQEKSRGTGLNMSSLGPKKPSDEEQQVGTSQAKAAPVANKEEPKTYKSVVEGKRAVPTANREKTEQKLKEREANPSLGRNGRAKEEEAAQKTVQKVKEKEAGSTPTVGGNVKANVLAKEEKVIERKKDGDIGQQKTGKKVKEEGITRTPTLGGSLEPKVHAKAEKVGGRKGDGEKGQKQKGEGKIDLGQKKQENYTKPVVVDEASRTEKKINATNRAEAELKMKERVERTALDVNGNMKIRQDEKNEDMAGDKVSEGEIQKVLKQKKIEETGLAKETGDLKDNLKAMERRRVDLGDPLKEETTRGGEDREKMFEKISESESSPLLIDEGQKKTNLDPSAIEGRGLEEEENQKYEISLVNVGVASLVIMGFGAYVFIPLVKMFY